MTQTIKKLIRLDLIALSGRQKRMIPVMILKMTLHPAIWRLIICPPQSIISIPLETLSQIALPQMVMSVL